MLSDSDYVQALLEAASLYAKEDKAVAWEAYMRNQYTFWGMTAGERKELLKAFLKKHGKPSHDSLDFIVRELWIDEHREAQYIAIELITRTKYWLQEDSIELFEWLITNKSWWDTVDLIASTHVGYYFQVHPTNKLKTVKKWNQSENMWLVRTSIIFQLKYKTNVNLALLSDCITPHLFDKEFFIQKAIGWSLRQVSRTHADWVRKFIDQHPLSKLAHKEASKYL